MSDELTPGDERAIKALRSLDIVEAYLPLDTATDPPQCAHKTRHSFKSYNKHDTHTLQCCKAKHDDAAHEWKDPVTGRTVIWFNDGPPPEIDYSTRFRFFKDR